MGNYQQNSRLSKPYALLKTFSEEELNSFAELIKSNYLTDKEEPYLLLKSLRRYALPNSDKFTTEFQLLIFKDMYRDEIIFKDWHIEGNAIIDKQIKREIDRQKKKLNKAMNELLSYAETFLKFETIRNKAKDKNEDDYNINYDIEILLPELRKRNQVSLYERHLKANEKKLDEEKKKGINYHLKFYKIQVEKITTQFIKINNKGLAKKDNYKNLEYHLDVYYLLEKLRYHLAKITLNDRYSEKDYNSDVYDILKKKSSCLNMKKTF